MSKESTKQAGGINSLSKLRTYSEGGISRSDAFAVEPGMLLEEEGFNSRGAFALDYWSKPDVVAHVRGFAESYKAGRFVPPIVVVVRNGDVLVRDGAHRRRGLMLAITEGAAIEKVYVVEQKGDEAEQAKLVLTANDGRPLSPLERAVQYAKLVAWGWSVARIGKEVNKTAEHVRTTLPLLELPIELKRMIAEETLAATLALSLYNVHGSKAVEYIKQAVEAKANEPQVLDELEQAVLRLAEGLAPAESGAGSDEEGEGKTVEPQAAAPAPEPTPRRIKITGKDVAKLTGTTPKISKKTVSFVHKSFEALAERIDQITLKGDRFVMEMSAEEFEMLKEMKAQLIAVSKPEPDQKDQAQPDLLDGQKDAVNSSGQTLQ